MKLISTTMLTIFQTLIKMIAGFVVIKIVSSLAGPEGVSILGVVQNINLIYVMLCGGIMATGITKYVAGAGRNKNLFIIFNIVKELETKLSVFATFTIVLLLFLLYRFSDDNHIDKLPLIIFSLCLTFLHAKVLVHLAKLNGLLKIRELAAINIFSALVSIFISIVVYSLHLAWEFAVIGLPLGYAIAYGLIAKPRMRFYRYYNALSVNIRVKSNIQKYALFGLTSAICLPLSQLVIRTYISNHISIYESGIWQGLVRFSEVYLVLISSALSVFLVPQVSSMSDGERIKKLITKMIILVSIVSIFGMLVIFYVKEFLIIILFDKSFLDMQKLFIYQLPGDFLKIISWVFAFSILGMGGVKNMLILEVIFSFTYVGFSIVGVNNLGIEGAIAAYTINYALYFLSISILFGVEVGKFRKVQS
ncbi:lipopolysaccharide biosynthesis protein [Vibrio cholerae]|uniref:hypothetical protein n=3 Tax=Vibrio cholerae TaxID=666 RepID=UPI001140ECA5|nr:hypothetical protein [Vibrio cholerae]MCD6670081.1 hypothetical protein [Vibrio cholerae]BCN19201.1 putative O-antigen flippase [Vibrio cholerae]GIB38217.1 lipopolysaccharide biosynthesis protein [Vibrio cholerae]HCJ7266119.1 hypothetical protein [Vibrio cholerae]